MCAYIKYIQRSFSARRSPRRTIGLSVKGEEEEEEDEEEEVAATLFGNNYYFLMFS